MEQVREFIRNTKYASAELLPLAGDASNRRYIRAALESATSMIMDTPAEGENFPAFVAIDNWLCESGYSAPKIMAKDMEKGFLLLEDLGDGSFTNLLREYPEKEEELYEAAIDVLIEWKNLVPPALPACNHEVYMREVSLFCDWFLPKALGEEKAGELRSEYLGIWRDILTIAPLQENIFVHRDYHADNLMWLADRSASRRIGLLDFQDGLIGDAAYDMVSLLEDARRDVSPNIVQRMKERYLKNTGSDKERFEIAYNILGAQRNSKIIGIFVRLCVRDGKENYLKLLPRVWQHLEKDILHPSLKSLAEWLEINVPKELRA